MTHPARFVRARHAKRAATFPSAVARRFYDAAYEQARRAHASAGLTARKARKARAIAYASERPQGPWYLAATHAARRVRAAMRVARAYGIGSFTLATPTTLPALPNPNRPNPGACPLAWAEETAYMRAYYALVRTYVVNP